jgi:PAS domain S-box-containing protein
MNNSGKWTVLAILGALCVAMFLLAQNLITTLEDKSLVPTHIRLKVTQRISGFATTLIVLSAIQAVCVVVLITILKKNGFGTVESNQLSEVLEPLNVSRIIKKREQLSQSEMIGLLQNTTRELAETRTIRQFLIERASHVVCTVDTRDRFVTVSKACRSAWGYSNKELEGRPLAEFLANAYPVLEALRSVVNSPNRAVVEAKLKARDGELLEVVFTAYWSTHDNALFCVVQDQTERKRVEDQLRMTLDALPAGVLIAGEGERIELANARACQLLRFHSTEIKGVRLSELYTANNSDGDDPNADTYNRFFHTLARRQDGTSIPIEVSTRNIEFAGTIKQLVVFLDITAQKETERLKSEFIAMLTHDLRTPIATLQGMLVLLEKGVLGELNAQGNKLAQKVGRDFDRLIRLINDMLDIEKVESGKMTMELSMCPLHEVIQHTLEVLQLQAVEKNLGLKVRLDEFICWGDRDQLTRVMMNLLSNAIKYCPEHSYVEVTLEDLGNEARVSVSDRGRGIPADKLNTIFDKFEQVEVADNKKRGGSGLGLAICKAIVSEHGGQISVYNNPSTGSTFWFTIPKHIKVKAAETV